MGRQNIFPIENMFQLFQFHARLFNSFPFHSNCFRFFLLRARMDYRDINNLLFARWAKQGRQSYLRSRGARVPASTRRRKRDSFRSVEWNYGGLSPIPFYKVFFNKTKIHSNKAQWNTGCATDSFAAISLKLRSDRHIFEAHIDGNTFRLAAIFYTSPWNEAPRFTQSRMNEKTISSCVYKFIFGNH